MAIVVRMCVGAKCCFVGDVQIGIVAARTIASSENDERTRVMFGSCDRRRWRTWVKLLALLVRIPIRQLVAFVTRRYLSMLGTVWMVPLNVLSRLLVRFDSATLMKMAAAWFRSWGPSRVIQLVTKFVLLSCRMWWR